MTEANEGLSCYFCGGEATADDMGCSCQEAICGNCDVTGPLVVIHEPEDHLEDEEDEEEDDSDLDNDDDIENDWDDGDAEEEKIEDD